MAVAAPLTEPRIVPREEHSISRREISRNTLKVLYRLNEAGYEAYMVGGGVRDLLLGRRPKDFDIATNARPEEIRRIFRNSRIIGRRFRLAHVFFHGEVVEVSTFRREPQAAAPGAELLITDDNTFGGPREDAFRRDFSINALFYNIADFSVIDYVGGMDDLRQGLVRVIGDPDLRFREDPVRMLRACEFAGRLGFTIESATQEAIVRDRRELDKAAPARVTEELVQLLKCGRAAAALQWTLDLGLLEVFLPEAYAMVTASERGLGNFGQILPVVDRFIGEGREISEATLLASILLPKLLLRRYDIEAVDQRPLNRSAVLELVRETVEPFFARFTLAKMKALEVAQALVGFHRLCEPVSKPGERIRIGAKPYFRDALALFEILAVATGEGLAELEQWQAVARRRAANRLAQPEAAQEAEVRRARRGRRGRRRR